VIFEIKLTLLQTIHILQYMTYIILKHTTFIKIHTNIIIFDTFNKTVPQRDLRISLHGYILYIYIVLHPI
jgi:hypothetical protein